MFVSEAESVEIKSRIKYGAMAVTMLALVLTGSVALMTVFLLARIGSRESEFPLRCYGAERCVQTKFKIPIKSYSPIIYTCPCTYINDRQFPSNSSQIVTPPMFQVCTIACRCYTYLDINNGRSVLSTRDGRHCTSILNYSSLTGVKADIARRRTSWGTGDSSRDGT